VSIERINPEQLPSPKGFSHAVIGHGTVVFLAGQTALNAEGRIAGDGIVEQFEVAFGNLLTALHAAGGRPDQLAGLTIYLTDMDDYKAHSREIGQVWRRLAGTEYPATAGIGVSRLWDVEALVEVQGYAVI
jgi:enamine deaminase RidA (YjgF/YER057c/UK114 family)